MEMKQDVASVEESFLGSIAVCSFWIFLVHKFSSVGAWSCWYETDPF